MLRFPGRRRAAACLGCAAALVLGVAAPPSLAGGDAVRLVAAKGTPLADADPDTTVDPMTHVLIDAAGDVLFDAFPRSRSGDTLRGTSWFLGDGSGVRRIVSGRLDASNLGDPVPNPAGIAVGASTVRSVQQAYLSPSGRIAFRGTIEDGGAQRNGVLAQTDAGPLRLLVAAGYAVPGLDCGLAVIGMSGQSDSVWVHDGFLFMGGSYGDTFDTPPCTPELANGVGVFVRRKTADVERIAYEDEDLAGGGGTYQRQCVSPRSLADGATVFRAVVRDPDRGDLNDLLLHDPAADASARFRVLARVGDPAPGLTEDVAQFGTATLGPRDPSSQAPRLVYALQLVGDGSWAFYDHAAGVAAAPVSRTGRTGGAFDLVAGLPGTNSTVAAVPYDTGLILVGQVEGGPVTGVRPVGVVRRDAAGTLTLLAAPGMTFDGGGTTYAVETIYSVLVNADGDVAVEATYREFSTKSVLLVVDPSAPGGLRCAVRAGDTVPLPGGTGTVTSVGDAGTPSFPAVFGAGYDGGPARMNGRDEIAARLTVQTGGVFGSAVYVVGGPGAGPQPGASDLRVKGGRGRVKVSGTPGADGVRVDLLGGGRVRVSGTGGTTVGGGSAPVEIDASKKLVLDLGDGDDTLEVVGVECDDSAGPARGAKIARRPLGARAASSPFGRRASPASGPAPKRKRAQADPCRNAGSVSVLMGPGSDSVSFEWLSADGLTLDAGGGRGEKSDEDGVRIGDSTVRWLTVRGGWGPLVIGTGDSDVGRASVLPGKGATSVDATFQDTVVRDRTTIRTTPAFLTFVRVHGTFTETRIEDFGERATWGPVSFTGGKGEDHVEVTDGARIAKLTARVSNGANALSVDGSEVGRLDLRGGADADAFSVAATVSLGVRATLGGGDDAATVDGLRAPSVRVDAGSGDDAVAVIDPYADGRTTARLVLGPGDDEVSVRSTSVSNMRFAQGYLSLIIDGGPGIDRLQSNVPSLYDSTTPPEFPGFVSVIDDIDGVVQLAKR